MDQRVLQRHQDLDRLVGVVEAAGWVWEQPLVLNTGVAADNNNDVRLLKQGGAVGCCCNGDEIMTIGNL